MGDYSYCRGTAKIKPALVEVLRDRFTRPTDNVDLDLWGDWNFVTLPECLTATSAYKVLCMEEKGSWIPGMGAGGKSRHLGEPPAECMSYSADGVLTFHTGYKNGNRTIEAFIALLIACSDTYEIEYDWYETMYSPDWDDPDSGLTVYSSSAITPEMLKELQDKVDRSYANAVDTREEFSPGQWRDKPKELSADLKWSYFNCNLARALKNKGLTMEGTVDWTLPDLGIGADMIAQLRALGISEDFLSGDPRYTASPNVVVAVKQAVAGTPFNSTPFTHDPRQVPVSVPDFDPLAHIMGQKLYSRGKKGIRQVKRAQRRKMNGK